MTSENIIFTLEQSLRQFRSAQTVLEKRLKQVEAEIKKFQEEADNLNIEISALEHSALQTRNALKSLLTTIE